MIPSTYTGRFTCRLQRVNDQGHNIVWILTTMLGIVFGLLLFGVPGALIGGLLFLVIGAFATKPKQDKRDVEKP